MAGLRPYGLGPLDRLSTRLRTSWWQGTHLPTTWPHLDRRRLALIGSNGFVIAMIGEFMTAARSLPRAHGTATATMPKRRGDAGRRCAAPLSARSTRAGSSRPCTRGGPRSFSVALASAQMEDDPTIVSSKPNSRDGIVLKTTPPLRIDRRELTARRRHRRRRHEEAIELHMGARRGDLEHLEMVG